MALKEVRAMKKIGYSEFVEIFGMDNPENWDQMGFELRPDGLYVKDPREYRLLSSEEIAVLTRHPTGDLSKPALAFPCSKEELLKIVKFYALEDCCDQNDIEKVIKAREDDYEAQTDEKINVRKTVVHEIAKWKRKNSKKNLTQREAAKEINDELMARDLETYNEKHLIRIIKYLGFKPGKPGRKPKK